MSTASHWEDIYASKNLKNVSWFQSHPTQSLNIIHRSDIPKKANIIDVGGGASNLVEELLKEGYENISVLDISSNALTTTQRRLGERSKQVQWIIADVLTADLPLQRFDLWHDRAVMHFLTNINDRKTYRSKVLASLKPGGFIVILAFAEDGPDHCSGLPVQRFSIDALTNEFGKNFYLVAGEKFSHFTPSGMEQKFVFCLFQLTSV